MYNFCIFAGTSEGRELIAALSGRGVNITACVATEYGETVLGKHKDVTVRSGRMDAGEMEAMLRHKDFALVIDATHPYAVCVSENIRAAAQAAGVEWIRLARAGAATEFDGIQVADVQAAADWLKATHGPVLLTTGSKDLPLFCADEALRARLYVRVLPMQESLQICRQNGIQPDRIYAMQGPFGEEMNLAMMNACRAKYIVTKDAGSAGGYAEKIAAARRAGAQAVVIGRPARDEGCTLAEALRMLETRYALLPARKQVVLAGIGMGDGGSCTRAVSDAAMQADCLIGAQRVLATFADAPGKQIYAVRAEEIAQIIHEDSVHRRFAVLFSGDSGFYSGAKKLKPLITDADVEVLAGIGSLQYFCARLGCDWENVRPLSLHGRDCNLLSEMRAHPAVFLLTGGALGAEAALTRLRDGGFADCTAHVGERLSYADERILSGNVLELADGHYDELSVLLVENPAYRERIVTPGLPDDAFIRDAVPMTKSEVRALTLAKLRLKRNSVVWDVGAGSGSISVEAAQAADLGAVYAVERESLALELIAKNAAHFALENLNIVSGDAPAALSDLPAPTHIFIGGSGGNLRSILDAALTANPAVRIVVNCVTLETLKELIEVSKEFVVSEAVSIAVSAPRALGSYHLMAAQNPVWIFTLEGKKI